LVDVSLRCLRWNSGIFNFWEKVQPLTVSSAITRDQAFFSANGGGEKRTDRCKPLQTHENIEPQTFQLLQRNPCPGEKRCPHFAKFGMIRRAMRLLLLFV